MIVEKRAVIGDPTARPLAMVRVAMPRRVLGVCGEMDHRAVTARHEMVMRVAAIRDRMVRHAATVRPKSMALAVNIGLTQTDHRIRPDRRKSPIRTNLATSLRPPFESLVSTRSRVSWSQPPRDRVALISRLIRAIVPAETAMRANSHPAVEVPSGLPKFRHVRAAFVAAA
jgi:hypothetical protein